MPKAEMEKYRVDTPGRKKLPKHRNGTTYKFALQDLDVYVQANPFEDGTLGEVFITGSKPGTLLAAFMDGFSLSTSMALQHGCPLESLCSKFINWKFEPWGAVPDEDIKEVRSLFDYIFRRLALDFLPLATQASLGLETPVEQN